MRVAIVGPDSAAKGGIATVIRQFKGISNSTIELMEVTTWREGSPLRHLSETLLSIISFPWFLKKNNITLVHFHVAQNGSFYRKAILLLIAKVIGIPTIFHLHGSQFDQFYNRRPRYLKRLICFVLEAATEVVVLSESWQIFCESIARINCQVMPNAVCLPRANHYQMNATKIISLGRLGERKGTYDLLKVAKRIEASYPDIQFILCGDGQLKEVAKKITQLGITNVQLGGWLSEDQKAEVLKDCKIHVLPSYQEGMLMAILETMAQGIPNISTRVGGIPQVISSEENGVLIEAGDVLQLEQAIRRLIENDHLAQTISQASYTTIQQHFSLEASYKKWRDYYQRLGEA